MVGKRLVVGLCVSFPLSPFIGKLLAMPVVKMGRIGEATYLYEQACCHHEHTNINYKYLVTTAQMYIHNTYV